MIRGYIIANPGDHYNSIKRNLGLKNGSLTYHLKVLEREDIVKSERDGVFKRFYPKDERIPADIMHVTKIQESILNEIIDNPGVTEKGLATNIGVSHQVVNYHVKKLVRANLVKTERLGKTTKYYPQED
jgi:predicted transcriptional regulator